GYQVPGELCYPCVSWLHRSQHAPHFQGWIAECDCQKLLPRVGHCVLPISVTPLSSHVPCLQTPLPLTSVVFADKRCARVVSHAASCAIEPLLKSLGYSCRFIP